MEKSPRGLYFPAGFWELLGLVGECEAGKRPGRGAGRTLGDFPLAAR